MSFRKTFSGVFTLLVIVIYFVMNGQTSGTLAAGVQQQGEPPEKTPQKWVPPDTGPEQIPNQQPSPSEPVFSKTDQAIVAAFQQAVDQNRSRILGLLLFEPEVNFIQYSSDGATALIWMALRDGQTGELVASEPGLSVARNLNKTAPDDPSSWSISLQLDDQFANQLQTIPAELLTDDIRMRYLEKPQVETSNEVVYSGYKLPWTAGLAKRITNSIGHYLTVSGGLTSCPATCKYAFDFADGTMFPLLAAKGGTVKAFRTTCANYDGNCTNYLILEDQSTNPTTYQVYYHMANDSVPERLRSPGAVVLRGEYVGDVDDTGYSTGHHLHYHVYATPTQANWSWGYSVDITFDDVSDNGGRPRTCAEASQYPALGAECQPENKYVSGNTPAHPPSATLSAPANRAVIKTKTLTVAGTANDDIQISRIQVLANYNGTWKTIDDIPPASGPYTKDVDLCSASIPDGPFAFTVRVYDREGSQAPGMPIRQLIKNYACDSGAQIPPPPACPPGDNQVALYTEPDYRGACQRYNLSSSGYTTSQLGLVGNNNAASIQVGKNVRAVLYDRDSDVNLARMQGRIETFEASDASLSDNKIGTDRVSGLWVLSREQLPDEPFFNSPIGFHTTNVVDPTSLDSLVLAWEGGSGATSFNVTLTGPQNITKTVTGNSLSLGSLPAGFYTALVTAKNTVGSNSTKRTFTVDPASLPTTTARSLPYKETLEASSGGWAATGLWRYASVTLSTWPTTKAWVYNNGTSYPDSTYRAGDLTSPPIAIPSTGTQYLRFVYFSDVEDGNLYWDQRWVQISADGGPFRNLRQLSNDKQAVQSWLNSGPISLADYRGKTIRLRFHFDTVDEDRNTGKGWVIDDISITDRAPITSCADNGSIPDLAMNAKLSGAICPEGDLDMYRISGQVGKPFIIDIDARTLEPASSLDSIIYLLDGDGTSMLAWNDDEVYGKAYDSKLPYTFSRTGTYYALVKAWDHPGAGGSSHFYDISLKPVVTKIELPLSVSILYPASSRLIPSQPFELSVSAKDFDGGQVARADFYWHGPDWSKPDWVKLNSDSTPEDGLSVILDPLAYGQVKGSALYVQAVSRTGGVRGLVWWDLQPDLYAPVSRLATLNAEYRTTVFPVTWSSSDISNDIDHFELQYQVNGGSWLNWPGGKIPANVRSVWFVGLPGNSYGFRVRGVDKLGNTESYPASAQATTSLTGACTPDANEIPGQSASNAIRMERSHPVSPQVNLCNSSQIGAGAGDEDWFSFDAVGGENIQLRVLSQGGNAAFKLDLYDSSGKLLNAWVSPNYNASISARFAPTVKGTYYMRVRPLTANPYGTDVLYQVRFASVIWSYLPLVNR